MFENIKIDVNVEPPIPSDERREPRGRISRNVSFTVDSFSKNPGMVPNSKPATIETSGKNNYQFFFERPGKKD